MNLKVIKYTNVPGTFEALWLDDEGKQVACVAYSGDQVDIFRSDVAKFGGDVDESLIAEIAAEWVPPELPQPVEVMPVDPVEKLKQFLVANPDVAEVLMLGT